MFADPSEAVFAIVKNFIDMEPHHDLRDELLRRILDGSIQRGLEDAEAGRVRDADEMFAELLRTMGAHSPPPGLGEKKIQNRCRREEGWVHMEDGVGCASD